MARHRRVDPHTFVWAAFGKPFLLVLLFGVGSSLIVPLPQAFAAERWVTITMPNITEHPDDPDLDTTPPYTLRWPGEGTTDLGSGDCDTTPPYRMSRRARTDLLSDVSGISKNGPFWKEGSFTSSDGGNHLAFFFHRRECYQGGPEYGFTRKLNREGANIHFYQCGACNTADQRMKRKVVWSRGDLDRTYRARVQSDGDFVIKIYRIEDDGSQTLVHSEIVERADWMPNLHASDGYITANAHTGNPDTADSFDGSYNQVDQAKALQP